VLWLREAALQLCLAPLKLLLGLIASDDAESSSSGSYLRALGFGACGPLVIGLLGPTRKGDRVL
jgi:hypothetical protein